MLSLNLIIEKMITYLRKYKTTNLLTPNEVEEIDELINTFYDYYSDLVKEEGV